MDKAILKKFAIESRQELMQKMNNKIKSYYIDEEFTKSQTGDIVLLSNDKHSLSLSKEEYSKRTTLIERIKDLSENGDLETGKKRVIEESAYTWFNRIVAIRYMEIHDYLPLTKDNQSLGIRVLSSKDNTPDPEILKFSNLTNPDLDIDFKKEKYAELKTDNDKFKYVLLLVCKKLGKVIPQVFDGVTEYIDILIPDNLLNDTGFVNKIIKEVPEDNFNEVEIIGWLYQYYNQTEKDRVISAKKAYKKNEIPYATQLFTPDWIVKYMVENSLGRYWIEHGGNQELIEKWKYFIKDNLDLSNKTITISELNSMKVKDLKQIKISRLKKITPIEIKCIDPCCGSGHILVYMFEVLYQIYESEGYNKSDIAELILKNNLYGLDIDDRAEQLSVLSILLKAREYDKNIFNKKIDLKVFGIKESNSISEDWLDSKSSRDIFNYVKNIYYNAKEYGSILNINNNDYMTEIKIINNMDNNMFKQLLINAYIPLLRQSIVLSDKYDVVVTNPPYNAKFNPVLKKYLEKYYSISKTDMFSVFMQKGIDLLNENGILSMINQHSWMFLQSFEKLRKYLINDFWFINILHLGANAFGQGDVGTIVQTVAFTLMKSKNGGNTTFIKLTDYNNPYDKEKEFKKINLLNNDKNKFVLDAKDFKLLPNEVFAYWLNNNYINTFRNKKISNYSYSKAGIVTGNDDYFIRNWFEISNSKINYNAKSFINSEEQTWVPMNKGGLYRKYYGNNEYIMRLHDLWNSNKTNKSVRRGDTDSYFKTGITWSMVSGNHPSYRLSKNKVYGVASPAIFCNDESMEQYCLGFLNSKISNILNEALNPTVNVLTGNVMSLPLLLDIEKKKNVEEYTIANINISKEDWDSFETSWDFIKHPLIEYKSGAGYADDKEWKFRIKDAYESWKSNCDEKLKLLKHNEEELNKIFIDIYGLQDELTPEESDKDVTIHKIFDSKEDIPEEMQNSQYALTKLDVIKSFISYAVGCMFGRYSLDENGLVYAGGEFDSSKYKTFEADADNIIPITENKYFEDDIVTKFVKFIEVVYGKNTLEENLDFIANTLGKRIAESSRETIRRYFINEFYNDHCNMYTSRGAGKRPIYWLFDSGKKNGFKALIYMHRYNDQTVSKIRLDYLHKMQQTYATELKDVEYKLNNNPTLSEKKELTKKQADLNAKILETNEYDEKVAHIADQRISIDLDDGVAVNYGKFSVKNPKTGKEESILANSKDIVKKTKNSKEE